MRNNQPIGRNTKDASEAAAGCLVLILIWIGNIIIWAIMMGAVIGLLKLVGVI